MSILIKGMEMPTSCLDCKVHYIWGSGSAQCLITGEFIDNRNAYEQKRLDNCPFVPVPPHGDLIDLNTVNLIDDPYEYEDWVKWALEQYLDAPIFMSAKE